MNFNTQSSVSGTQSVSSPISNFELLKVGTPVIIFYDKSAWLGINNDKIEQCDDLDSFVRIITPVTIDSTGVFAICDKTNEKKRFLFNKMKIIDVASPNQLKHKPTEHVESDEKTSFNEKVQLQGKLEKVQDEISQLENERKKVELQDKCEKLQKVELQAKLEKVQDEINQLGNELENVELQAKVAEKIEKAQQAHLKKKKVQSNQNFMNNNQNYRLNITCNYNAQKKVPTIEDIKNFTVLVNVQDMKGNNIYIPNEDISTKAIVCNEKFIKWMFDLVSCTKTFSNSLKSKVYKALNNNLDNYININRLFSIFKEDIVNSFEEISYNEFISYMVKVELYKSLYTICISLQEYFRYKLYSPRYTTHYFLTEISSIDIYDEETKKNEDGNINSLSEDKKGNDTDEKYESVNMVDDIKFKPIKQLDENEWEKPTISCLENFKYPNFYAIQNPDINIEERYHKKYVYKYNKSFIKELTSYITTEEIIYSKETLNKSIEWLNNEYEKFVDFDDFIDIFKKDACERFYIVSLKEQRLLYKGLCNISQYIQICMYQFDYPRTIVSYVYNISTNLNVQDMILEIMLSVVNSDPGSEGITNITDPIFEKLIKYLEENDNSFLPILIPLLSRHVSMKDVYNKYREHIVTKIVRLSEMGVGEYYSKFCDVKNMLKDYININYKNCIQKISVNDVIKVKYNDKIRLIKILEINLDNNSLKIKEFTDGHTVKSFLIDKLYISVNASNDYFIKANKNMFNVEPKKILISEVNNPQNSHFDFNNLVLCINKYEVLKDSYQLYIHKDSETGIKSLRARKIFNSENFHLVYLDTDKNKLSKLKKIEKNCLFFVKSLKLERWIDIQHSFNYDININNSYRVRNINTNEYKELDEGTLIFHISHTTEKNGHVCFTNNITGSKINIYDIKNVQMKHNEKWKDFLDLPPFVFERTVAESQLIQFIRESYCKF